MTPQLTGGETGSSTLHQEGLQDELLLTFCFFHPVAIIHIDFYREQNYLQRSPLVWNKHTLETLNETASC